MYWKKIIGTRSEFKETSYLNRWSQKFSDKYDNVVKQEHIKTWEFTLKKTKPWKAPGPDRIHAYWWKNLVAANNLLFKWLFNQFNKGKKFPAWFCQGRAILLHKFGDHKDPGNFRTICCLNTAYKLGTGLLTQWL